MVLSRDIIHGYIVLSRDIIHGYIVLSRDIIHGYIVLSRDIIHGYIRNGTQMCSLCELLNNLYKRDYAHSNW